MKLRRNDAKVSGTIVVVSVLAAITLGLVALTWVCIENLQENSEKMRRFDVKPTVEKADGAALDKSMFPNRDVVDDKMPHEESYKMFIRARSLLDLGMYKQSKELYLQSIKSQQDDMAK